VAQLQRLSVKRFLPITRMLPTKDLAVFGRPAVIDVPLFFPKSFLFFPKSFLFVFIRHSKANCRPSYNSACIGISVMAICEVRVGVSSLVIAFHIS
jgi:hypothetical protein